MIYSLGTHELPRDTKHLGVGVRIQVFDPQDKDEVALVNGLQDPRGGGMGPVPRAARHLPQLQRRP